MKSLYESIMQSRFPAHKIEESILNKSGVGLEVRIDEWCKKHGIKDYTINNKGEIDSNIGINISHNDIKELPSFIRFGTVKEYFYCNSCGLTSLKGCPRVVEGDFSCSDNNLKTLEGAPEKVEGDFSCFGNSLTSLEGAPEKVGGYFNCSHNFLEDLKGSPKEVGDYFNCGTNNLKSLEGAPKKVGASFSCRENFVRFTEADVKKICKVKQTIYV